MSPTLTSKDLALRILAIFLTSLILLFVTHDSHFDLHFKIRKPQVTSEQVHIVEVSQLHRLQEAIEFLKTKAPKAILVNREIYDLPGEGVIPFSSNQQSQSNLNFSWHLENDGLVRQVTIAGQAPFLKSTSKISNQKKILNFRGPEGTFSSLNFFDLNNVESNLKNKWVVVRVSESTLNFTTPLGLLSESELVANVLDNQIESRFLNEKSFFMPIVILLFLLLMTTAFLIYLPSTLALITSIAIAISYISLSLWIFDNYSVWTPMLIPVVQLVLTFLLISNYKFALNERTRWSLEKENLFLDQVEEMKTNFLSLFSHDLKTPLSKIIGISDTLRSKVKEPEVLAEINKIHDASKNLEKYIKRILKMSMVQSKNISLVKSPQDINQLIEKSIEQNRDLAMDKNITVTKDITPIFMIDMDGPLIQEVLINFIENAITYSPENSEILVTSSEINKFVKVSVKDQGKGIPKEAQESIWEKYYRFDSDQSGYGLGLFLSRYVIHLHKGQVFLNSKENGGSEFGFLLPIDEEQV